MYVKVWVLYVQAEARRGHGVSFSTYSVLEAGSLPELGASVLLASWKPESPSDPIHAHLGAGRLVV